MKKTFLSALIGAVAFIGSSAVARTIVDDMDRTVSVPDQIQRMVITNVYPYASVATVFLGGTDKIVGISPVAMSAAKNGLLGELYPDIKSVQTNFMQSNSINIEALMRLKPDVVIANAGDIPTIKQVENAGIPVVAVSTSKWNYDVVQTYDNWIKTLSTLFPEHDKSDKAAQASKRALELVQKRTAHLKPEERKGVLFLFQYGPKRMITSGKNFFGQYWCDAIGARNVASKIQTNNANALINMEHVYAWNPDVVFITNFTPTLPKDLYEGTHDNWSNIKAVRNKQVYKMPLGVYRSYTPSADTPLTLLWMAKTVYPELFSDIDLTVEVRNYYKELFGVTLTDEQIASIYIPDASRSAGFSRRPGSK